MMAQKAIFPILIVFLLAGSACAGTYSGGTGEPNSPYRIGTPNDLNDIGNHLEDWGSHFVMVNDINLAEYTGTQFNIIGSSYPDSFTGVFDGSGHRIFNFNYETNSGNNIGLFGSVYGIDCEIKNLAFENPNVRALTSDYVGVLAGYNSGKISDCLVTGGVVYGNHSVGGLVGVSQGTLSRVYASVLVNGDLFVGGLAGEVIFASIYDSYSAGTCRGDAAIGGLAGFVNGPEVLNCYSVAVVDGNTAVGSLTGLSHCTAYHECFFNELVNPDVNAVGEWLGQDPNAHAKNTVQMQQRSTFTNVGWDFVEVWDIGEKQTYPFLRVYPAGDIDHDDRVNFFDFAIIASHWLEEK